MTTPELIAQFAAHGIIPTLVAHSGEPADNPAAATLFDAANATANQLRRDVTDLFAAMGVPEPSGLGE